MRLHEMSCTRFLWTPICPIGGRCGEVQTNRIKRNDVAVGPVGSEGGRSPSALSAGQNGAMAGVAVSGQLIAGQRWRLSRKREVVLRLLRGEAAEDLSRELGGAALQARALASEGRSRAGLRVEGTRSGCGER